MFKVNLNNYIHEWPRSLGAENVAVSGITQTSEVWKVQLKLFRLKTCSFLNPEGACIYSAF